MHAGSQLPLPRPWQRGELHATAQCKLSVSDKSLSCTVQYCIIAGTRVCALCTSYLASFRVEMHRHVQRCPENENFDTHTLSGRLYMASVR
jgi:hypothetical protein